MCKGCFTAQESAASKNLPLETGASKHIDDEKIVNELENTLERNEADDDTESDDDPDINFEVRPEKLSTTLNNSLALNTSSEHPGISNMANNFT